MGKGELGCFYSVPHFIPEFQEISKVPAHMDNKFSNSILHDRFHFPVLRHNYFFLFFFLWVLLAVFK